jgi:hypothetical protein
MAPAYQIESGEMKIRMRIYMKNERKKMEFERLDGHFNEPTLRTLNIPQFIQGFLVDLKIWVLDEDLAEFWEIWMGFLVCWVLFGVFDGNESQRNLMRLHEKIGK